MSAIQFRPEWIETSPTNHYGERVVAHVIISTRDGEVRYRCKDQFWQVAHQAWCAAYKSDPSFPAPMSEGHCMFIDPIHYGCVPEDCTSAAYRRRAIRATVIADLNGWDRELRKSMDGMRTLARIVRATVAAKMVGQETGGGHFVACLMAGIGGAA